MIPTQQCPTARSPLCTLTATELATRIRRKDISPVEVVEASLARVADVQSTLNPFCFVYADEALAQAKAAEDALMRGHSLGPLHGVPIAIKDFTPTKGKRTTRGSKVFEHWVPDFDPVIVQRLAAAGAILIGKTTTPEFAYSSFTRSKLWGDTLNPWDATRTSGGSSGGSAVAVATGCVALAEGTDMGGSVRIPAALCGVVGHKPSLGRIPMDILPSVFDAISHFGPLARCIDDAALFLRVAEGQHPADIQSQREPAPLPSRINTDVRGLRIAVSEDLGFYQVQEDVCVNLHSAAEQLRTLGAEVESVALAWSADVAVTWWRLWEVMLAASFGDHLNTHRDTMDPDVVSLIEAGLEQDAVSYKRLEHARTAQWHELAKVFAQFDALLCPTTAITAPLASARDADFEHIDNDGRLAGLDMTSPFNNVAQCPALSVPSGFCGEGRPTAVQIVTRPFDDAMALRIGAALEAAYTTS